MSQSVTRFYDSFAETYRYIFPDWHISVRRQGNILNQLLEKHGFSAQQQKVYDCTCGIGTQSFGLAIQGWQVHGTDLSSKAIELAGQYATEFDLPHTPTFEVMDLLNPSSISTQYDVVIALDNAIPHFMNDDDLATALRTIHSFLADDGITMISIRDYDSLLENPPKTTLPSISDAGEGRHIIFQTWDWADDLSSYQLNMYVTQHVGDTISTQVFTSEYRALRRETLSNVLAQVGFDNIEWLMPDDSGFYQPFVIARKS